MNPLGLTQILARKKWSGQTPSSRVAILEYLCELIFVKTTFIVFLPNYRIWPYDVYAIVRK